MKLLSIFKRLKEPSTWAGFGVLLSLFNLQISGEQWTAIISLGTAAAGAAAVFLPEFGNKTAEETK